MLYLQSAYYVYPVVINSAGHPATIHAPSNAQGSRNQVRGNLKEGSFSRAAAHSTKCYLTSR